MAGVVMLTVVVQNVVILSVMAPMLPSIYSLPTSNICCFTVLFDNRQIKKVFPTKYELMQGTSGFQFFFKQMHFWRTKKYFQKPVRLMRNRPCSSSNYRVTNSSHTY